jgi:23S rRNA pseudouridine2604 synthase
MEFPIRINKYLRDKNLASRREADKLVEAGLVFINGKRAESGQKVNEADKITLKENKNNIKELKYFLYYKPKGLPTQDRPKMQSVILQWQDKKVYPVGRLDKESEGLLFLTNDGRFSREVLSEKQEWEKEYLVTTKEHIRAGIEEIFQSAMETDAFGKLKPVKSKILGKNKISMILNEGKRHQIRVMMSEMNYEVTSLKRIRIGKFSLGALKPGESKPIKVYIKKANLKNDK